MPNINKIIADLYRTEFSKITSVLGKLFGFEFIEIAEDIAGDTFLQASENWAANGLPDNPTAWLYTVAKNKAKDYLKHDAVFRNKVIAQYPEQEQSKIEVDLSSKNIKDSMLRMMFAICNPNISTEAQIGLSLRILCGFSIDEIVAAFLSNKETINKRLFRAKEKLREEKVTLEFPETRNLDGKLSTVLTTLYLLFNEGYYSVSKNKTLRKDLCLEAMRLSYLLIENESTNKPAANALVALMCFHASRFDARIATNGELILYSDQDTSLWNKELIMQGKYFLNKAASGKSLSKFHLEAAIAYWHTEAQDTIEKWDHILQLYNKLLIVEYSPIAALNRTYALAKVSGKPVAITEALKLNLHQNHLYHSLLGYLYTDVDNTLAYASYQQAHNLSKTANDKKVILKHLENLASPKTN